MNDGEKRAAGRQRCRGHFEEKSPAAAPAIRLIRVASVAWADFRN
jgi:hypothetical protein